MHICMSVDICMYSDRGRWRERKKRHFRIRLRSKGNFFGVIDERHNKVISFMRAITVT